MSELLINPQLELSRLHKDGAVAGYVVVAPVRGRGAIKTTLLVNDAAGELLGFFHQLLARDADIELTEATCERLAELGVLITADEISAPVTFRCRWNVVSGSGLSPAIGALRVNDGLALITFDEFAARNPTLAKLLEPADAIAVVTDPTTGIELPYWVEAGELPLFRRLRPSAAIPHDLGDADVTALFRAGIVVAADVAEQARLQQEVAIATFAQRRFVQLPQVLPPTQVLALREYYLRLTAEGRVQSHDEQVLLRFVQHNELLMGYYHRQLCPWFSQVVGEPLKPSYSYFASYRQGAVLKKHIDRAQCAFTASLLLDFEEGVAGDDWPLYLELPGDETVAVVLTPGDGLIFRGRELPHYRQSFRGERSMSYLLHYVDPSFAEDVD